MWAAVPMFAATAKGAKIGPPRSRLRPSPCCAPGCTRGPALPPTLCSRAAATYLSALTPSNGCSTSTLSLRRNTARRWEPRSSPHVLRHTCAMNLLQAGVDISVIALWLGHESVQTTQIYLHADLTLKERALSRTAPPNIRPGRYRPPDALLAFLESL